MAPMVEIRQLGPVVIGVMWAETIVALPFVALRLFCRAKIHKGGLGWDDGFMLASWVCHHRYALKALANSHFQLLFVAYSGACTAATRWGFGVHMAELKMVQFAEANKLEIVGQTMLIAAIATSKMSIAVFLLRIAVKTWQRMVLYASIVSLCIICFLCAALNFFQCNPIRHVWNPTVPAKCWMSVTPLAIATGGQYLVLHLSGTHHSPHTLSGRWRQLHQSLSRL